MGKIEVNSLSQLPRQRKPRHDRLDPRASTGWLALRLSTIDDEALGVIPGSGALALYGTASDGHTVEACTRRQGTPIIPGTGLKGAIRMVYELLTGSCNITDPRARCRGGGLEEPVCAACSLFGHLGYAGRLAFDDAVPDGDGAVKVRLTEVPVAWGPRRSSASYRLYDGKAAVGPEGMEPKDWVPVELYQGRFRARVRFRNATEEELGRLFLALGQGEGQLAFLPKLGGKKYDGQGAVRVEVVEVALREGGGLGTRRHLEGEAAKQFVAGRIGAAKRDRSWAWATVEAGLAALAAKLKEGY